VRRPATPLGLDAEQARGQSPTTARAVLAAARTSARNETFPPVVPTRPRPQRPVATGGL